MFKIDAEDLGTKSLSFKSSCSSKVISKFFIGYIRQFFENRYGKFITMSYRSKCWGKIWVYKGFTFLFVNSCQIDSTKIAIVGIVFWLLPNHWNAKLQSFSRTLRPLPQVFNTSFTDYMWSPWFVLITKLYAKIVMISFSNKLCYTITFTSYFELTTNVTKLIRMI